MKPTQVFVFVSLLLHGEAYQMASRPQRSSTRSTLPLPLSRRDAIFAAPILPLLLLLSQSCRALENPIAARLHSSSLPYPGPGVMPAPSEDLFYPDWMEGTWRVSATLSAFSAPQGGRFLSGGVPGKAGLELAQQTLDEQTSKVVAGASTEYQLRFKRGNGGVREDRKFNAQQRLDGYAGRRVVREVKYLLPNNNEAPASAEPTQISLVNFRYSAVQKVFTSTQRSVEAGSTWWGSEVSRTILARTDKEQRQLVADLERIEELQLQPDGSVEGVVRIAGYLTPQDQLYFEAGNQAVTLSDYRMVYRKVPPQIALQEEAERRKQFEEEKVKRRLQEEAAAKKRAQEKAMQELLRN